MKQETSTSYIQPVYWSLAVVFTSFSMEKQIERHQKAKLYVSLKSYDTIPTTLRTQVPSWAATHPATPTVYLAILLPHYL